MNIYSVRAELKEFQQKWRDNLTELRHSTECYEYICCKIKIYCTKY